MILLPQFPDCWDCQECATMPGKGVIISASVQHTDCCCRKAWPLPHSPWKHTCWRSPESESRTQASMRIFWKEHLKHYSNGYGCLRRLDSILFCPFFFFLTGSLLYSLDWHRICANPPASASLVLVQMCPILSSQTLSLKRALQHVQWCCTVDTGIWNIQSRSQRLPPKPDPFSPRHAPCWR